MAIQSGLGIDEFWLDKTARSKLKERQRYDNNMSALNHIVNNSIIIRVVICIIMDYTKASLPNTIHSLTTPIYRFQINTQQYYWNDILTP